ncbi:preprotein translocase subunit SecE [Bowmanella sp. JS7-9]|jgi:preprotein translocase subunit SecE|uniref:Protein translocase subunit SecE n=1 Tax=Pseudobowmanella zhangzhouensis TaxID=1537679 RepID=A0ABW1XFQ6_9ALTE|nr:preprotein translocase subunit SecE [Bowmanella sp. JS7-9]TBX19841.1 preprotein translocase subunit SecE [Bowmanella sp. JS7-9]
MSVNTDNTRSPLDLVKWLIAVALVAAAVGGNLYYSEFSVLERAVAVVALIIAALFVAANTNKGKTFREFAKEARIEVRKVVWPTKQETTHTTLIIFAAVLIMSLILWGLDGIIVRFVNLITSLGL